MTFRALAGIAIVMCVLHTSNDAAADEGLDACGAAAVNAQKLRRAGKLREARTWLEVCAQPSCREDIAVDCRTWRAEVERSVASVVLRLVDERGQPVVAGAGVRVLVDGMPVAADDLAKSVMLDPGTHAIDVQATGGAHVEKTVVLGEGEHADVPVTLPARPAPTAARATAATNEESAPQRRTIPPSVFVAGGIALVGLATFGVVGGLGYSDWKSSACDAHCDHVDASRVRTKLVVADVGLGIGLVAGAVAAWLYLSHPTAKSARLGGFFSSF